MSRSHDSFGGGAGEGLAAVRGHQSGAKGMQAEMPAFSREIEAIGSFDSASRTNSVFFSVAASCDPPDAARSASAPYQLED